MVDDWEEYESAVAVVVTELKRQGAHITGSGRTHRIVGASGYRHQIDIAVEGPPGQDGQRHLMVYECKHWAAKVKIDAVLSLFARVHDIQRAFDGTVEGVVVSKSGFTEGAKRFARHYGIHCDKLEPDGGYNITTPGHRDARVVATTALVTAIAHPPSVTR